MIRKLMKRLILTSVVILSGAGAAVAPVSPAQARTVSPNYVAGSAVAGTPVYDPITWTKSFKCTFSGWAHVPVIWDCKLKDGFTGAVYDEEQGGFSNGSVNPGPWTIFHSNTYMCTVAYAAYTDGSDSDSDTSCG